MTRAQLTLGLTALLLAIVSWGPMFPLAKRALLHVDAYWLGTLRYCGATVLFLTALWWTEGRQALRYEGRFGLISLFGLAGIVGYNLLVWIGLSSTRPEHAAILMALQTPLTALLYWVWKSQRPLSFTIACMVVALFGVALVVTNGNLHSAFADGSLVGDLLVLAGAACWIVYTAGMQFTPNWSPLRFTALSAIPGCIGLIVALSIATATGAAHTPGVAALGSIAWQLGFFTLFSTFLGVLCFNIGIKNVGALNAMLLLNMVPVVTFAIEAALGRRFTWIEICGAGLVIAALIANNLYLRWRTRATAS